MSDATTPAVNMDAHESPITLILRRIWRRLGPLTTYSVAFSLIEAAVLAPTAAGVLRLALQSWGRCSVGNFEIVAFFLSPVGLAGLALLTALQLTTFHLRTAGVMGVLAGDGPGVWHAFDAAKRLPAVLKVDLLQAVLYLILGIPFAAAGALAYKWLWGPHDLNRLVVDRPREFWEGVIVVGAIALVYVGLALWLYLRWLFAVQAVLFEEARLPWTALRASAARTSGRLGRLGLLMLGGGAATLGGWFALSAGLSVLNGYVLDHVGHGPKTAVAATTGLLAFDGLTLAAYSATASAILAALGMAEYRRAGGAIREAVVSEPKARWWTTAAFALSAGALVPAALTADALMDDVPVAERVEITAHRAGAHHGPENTVAALRVAAEAGAEWAEIDVQQTRDGHLVIAHDDDLIRIAGSPLRITDSTLEQLRSVDVGTPFDPRFAGERIATLEEFLEASHKLPIRLNIELKAKNDAEAVALVEPVVEAVRKAHEVQRVHICGQSVPALAKMRRIAPDIDIGFISGAVIGDPTRLDVEFLMMEARLADRTFVDRARRRGKAVHAWTINTADRVPSLVDDGVLNIITDDVPAIRARLDEIAQLDPLERIILRVRHALARR